MSANSATDLVKRAEHREGHCAQHLEVEEVEPQALGRNGVGLHVVHHARKLVCTLVEGKSFVELPVGAQIPCNRVILDAVVLILRLRQIGTKEGD